MSYSKIDFYVKNVMLFYINLTEDKDHLFQIVFNFSRIIII